MPALTFLFLLAPTEHHVLSLYCNVAPTLSLSRPPQVFLFFPFATLCVMPWATLPSAAGVRGRQLTVVSSWAETKSACGSISTSGTVTLRRDFVIGTYTLTPSPQYGGIDFSGKQLVIIGNSMVLDAGEGG
jgi:hypothetical protein